IRSAVPQKFRSGNAARNFVAKARTSSRPRHGACSEYSKRMSGAASSSITAGSNSAPQNSVNQRPTIFLFSSTDTSTTPPVIGTTRPGPHPVDGGRARSVRCGAQISRRLDPRRLPGMGVTRLSLLVLLAAPFLAQVDATIANVATPDIQDSLGASGAAAQLVIDGYLVAYAALLLAGARLGRSHGYKRLFLIGMATFTVASLASGLAPDAAALVGARVVQGIGAALMFPQA